jgi:hypothetical protein
MARILSGVGLDLLDLGKGASACIVGFRIRVTGSHISDFQKK